MAYEIIIHMLYNSNSWVVFNIFQKKTKGVFFPSQKHLKVVPCGVGVTTGGVPPTYSIMDLFLENPRLWGWSCCKIPCFFFQFWYPMFVASTPQKQQKMYIYIIYIYIHQQWHHSSNNSYSSRIISMYIWLPNQTPETSRLFVKPRVDIKRKRWVALREYQVCTVPAVYGL